MIKFKHSIVISLLSFGVLTIVSCNINQTTKWVNAIDSNTINIKDDFTNFSGSGTIMSNGVTGMSHATENSNVLAFASSWMGAFPSSDNVVKTSYNTTTGYLTYKIESGKNGLYIKNTKLDLSFGVTTNGIYNNPYFSSSMNKANLIIEVSEDNLIYETAYDFLNDKSMYHEEENPYVASNTNVSLGVHYKDTKTIIYSDYVNHGFVTYKPSIDLSSYSVECLFIRIKLIQCPASEIKPSASTLAPIDIGERLYKVNISADTTNTPSTNSSFYLFENFRNNSLKMGNLKGEFHNLKTEGSIAHGLIPSYEWGAEVNAGNGYILYKIPVNGNGIFSTFNSLVLKTTYFLTGNNESDIQVEIGFDLEKLENVCSFKENYGISSSTKVMSLDLSIYASGMEKISNLSAINSSTLFVKINVFHKSGLFSLGALGVKLFDITFKGKINFSVNSGISLKYGSDDIGLRFSSLIEHSLLEKLQKDGYEIKCGTLIMPYDYLSTYGELNYENVFSDNSIYCFDEVSNKIKIIMSYAQVETFSSSFDVIYGSLNKIKDKNIARNFISRGVIIATRNNKTSYLFASYANGDATNNMVNMYDVARVIISETSDYYLKQELQRKYIDKVVDEVANYTAVDVYFYADGTTYMVTKRVNSNLIGTEVSIKLDAQSSGSITPDGVIMGGKLYRYYDELPSSCGVTHYSNTSGYIRADGKLTLVRYYQADAA